MLRIFKKEIKNFNSLITEVLRHKNKFLDLTIIFSLYLSDQQKNSDTLKHLITFLIFFFQ